MSKQKFTLLENIQDKYDNISNLPEPKDLKPLELYDYIFDLSTNENYRLNCLNEYVQQLPDETPNIINKLNSMFIYSYSKIIENYLFVITLKTNIDINLRLECAKCLSYNSVKGYIALNELCSKFSEFSNLATTLKIDAVCCLMKHKEYKEQSLGYFITIINDNNIEPLFRYKTIQSLEFKLDNKEELVYFTKNSCISFLENLKNPIRYRILACQYLFRKCEPDNSLKNWIENQLLEFGRDNELDMNVRADAVDILLQSGSEEVRKMAADLIVLLGTGGKAKTIFDNSQNVHHKAIEESASKILEFLNTIPNKNKEGGEIEFEGVRKCILELIENKKKEFKEKVEAALTRIFIDRAVYSQYNMSLMNILVKIWCYIDGHQYQEEMQKRLLEELYDSSEVCSTGYAFRIVNVISGYGELSIEISFEDQIVGNLSGRLNKKIGEIEDEDFQSEIIEQMAINPTYFELRGKFLKFFRENISQIRQEMYIEFKDYMSDTDYDLYFRKAILNYEGSN
jgi:hypothetical protein